MCCSDQKMSEIWIRSPCVFLTQLFMPEGSIRPDEYNERQTHWVFLYCWLLMNFARAGLNRVPRYTWQPIDSPGQCCTLQGRPCLKAPLHVLRPKGWDGFTHLRILDCIPPPQDLLHLLYSPQAVHVPSDDCTEVASILTLSAGNRQFVLFKFLFHVAALLFMFSASVITGYYSFKISPRFWLVKTTHIIHHKQLLLTKFEKNLRHIESTTRCRLLNRKPGDQIVLFLVSAKTKSEMVKLF